MYLFFYVAAPQPGGDVGRRMVVAVELQSNRRRIVIVTTALNGISRRYGMVEWSLTSHSTQYRSFRL